jgi:hypothetical protein
MNRIGSNGRNNGWDSLSTNGMRGRKLENGKSAGKTGVIAREPADSEVVPRDTRPTKKALALHKNLKRAESSMLVQLRTAKIGFAKFLYERKVPSYTTTQCTCGEGEETPRHVALYCSRENDRRHHLRPEERPVTPLYRWLTGRFVSGQ